MIIEETMNNTKLKKLLESLFDFLERTIEIQDNYINSIEECIKKTSSHILIKMQSAHFEILRNNFDCMKKLKKVKKQTRKI